jgi:dienelactone hydrolase
MKSQTLLAFLCGTLTLQMTGAQSAANLSQWSVERLSQRSYDGGPLLVEGTLPGGPGFTRLQIRFQSDGLTEYGFADVPDGPGPFPVIVVVHGHVNALSYRTTTYTTRFADTLARAGFLVLHPDLRGHGRSQGQTEPPFLAGYAVDVLNLIGSVRIHPGQGVLRKAMVGKVGLWGHSDGGNVVLRALVVKPGWIGAAVLYSAISGDERQNAAQDAIYGDVTRSRQVLSLPPALLDAVSPSHFLNRITAPLSIHSGTADTEGPPGWAATLCHQLATLKQRSQCFSYRAAPHLFPAGSRWDTSFVSRTTAFFQKMLVTKHS